MSEQPLGSNYVLDAQLGSGAMGVVYSGRDQQGRRFAFKLLRPEFARNSALVQRFVQERSALTGVVHPNVVRTHDLVVEGNTLAVVMDLVEGGDLRRVLNQWGNLPPADVAYVGGQIAAGLAAVHAAGIVHRDVKPENVLLDRSAAGFVPRVTDFGIARLADATGMTQSSLMLGTPNYVAPELAEGLTPTGAVDVYSLGIMLYELAAGVTPFQGGNHLAVIRRHADAEVPRPAGVPDDLWTTIQAMTSKNPAARPSAAEVAASLAALAPKLQGVPAAPRLVEPMPVKLSQPPQTPSTPAEAPKPVTGHPRKKRKGLLVAALAVGVLVLAGGGFVAVQALSGQEPDEAVLETPVPTPSPTASATPSKTPTPSASTAAPKMPDVVGTTLSAARVELRGVTITVVEEFSETVTDGVVLAQSVAAGEAWPSEVELVVAKQPVLVYLSDLKTTSYNNLSGGKGEINGVVYPHAVLMNGRYGSKAYGEWNLSKGYRELVGVVGISDNTQYSQNVAQVEVFLDQRKVWSERVSLGNPVDLNVDVTDALRLRIEVTSVTGNAFDVVLGGIRLLGLPGEVPDPKDR